MDTIAVNRLTNCNVYIDGIGLLGRAEEIEVPRPKHKMTDHKGLGMVGVAEFWSGVEKLESKIKWASLYAEVEALLHNPFQTYDIQVRGSLESYTSAGRADEVPVIYLASGAFKDSGNMNFKQHENVDMTSMLTVYHCQLFIAGFEVFLYDVMSNTYTVAGDDLLQQYRLNIGG